jgi:hypothetical protein
MKLPNNVGKSWTKTEENQLMEEIKADMDIETIAKDHGRTIKGIEMRIESIIYKKSKFDNYTNNVLANLFNKSEDDIQKIIDNFNIKDKKISNPSIEIININERLDKIEKLLNKIYKKIK